MLPDGATVHTIDCCTLTCVGISPSDGNRTQFLHILVTMSSRNTTTSWVQYCKRHGLEVKVAVGTRSRISSVIRSGIAGLQQIIWNRSRAIDHTESFAGIAGQQQKI